MDQTLSILFGALIASIVPIATLIINRMQWRIEKKIELLRLKHDRLLSIYTEALDKIGSSLADETWPSDVTSKILVYGSKEVQNTIESYVTNDERSDSLKSSFYYQLSEACNKHLLEIQDNIENLL
ncbi:hypothetical protein [Pseudomonas sp. 8Z]|uniref:hypothetical protein n=1 Tax=Pseudomonas sp. 8Z TaxID=2653166 RepID=UPI001357049A|nr:hypothetical protein [Pseudomonas sp. 8Z]